MNNHLSFIRGASAGTAIPNNIMPGVGVESPAVAFHIASFNTNAAGTLTKPERRLSTQYEIFLFTYGTGVFESGYARKEIKRGCALCIKPGSAFSIAAHELQGYHISFSACFFSATDVAALPLLFQLLYHSNSEPLMNVIGEDALEPLIAVVAGMQKEYIAPRERSKNILEGLFFVFMTYLPCISKPVKQGVFSDRLFEYASHFIELVRTHFHEHKQVADYARMMCVTPSFLNNVVKKKTGQTASRHIYDTIVLEAKKKATFTTASMKEIAYELGFVDIYHFSKFFKKNSGTNFSRFRKEQGGIMLQVIE